MCHPNHPSWYPVLRFIADVYLFVGAGTRVCARWACTGAGGCPTGAFPPLTSLIPPSLLSPFSHYWLSCRLCCDAAADTNGALAIPKDNAKRK